MKDFNIKDVYSIVTNKLESWITDLITILPNLAVAIILMVLVYFLARLIKKLTYRSLSNLSKNISLNHLVANILYIIVIFIGAFIALDVLKLEKTVTSLLAGIGVVGLALGFAFQDIAANFISGIILTIRTPIKSGDIVEIASVMGTVIKINLRSTEIETFQGTLVIIPNRNVFQNPMYNYSHFDRRRIDLECGISYSEDLEMVKELTIKVVNALPLIDKNKKTLFNYHSFGDSSINFTVKAWLMKSNQQEYNETISQMVMAMKKAYDEKGINIPFPIRTLDFKGKKVESMEDLVGQSKA